MSSRSALALALAVTPALGFAQAQPSANQVLERALEALGGRSSLAAIETRSATGSATIFGGFPARYRSWAKAPNKLKTQWDMQYISQARGFDGEAGWDSTAGVRELVGPELTRLASASEFAPLLNLQTSRAGMTLTTAALEGRTVYRVDVVQQDGRPRRLFFDSEDYLLVREERVEPYEDGDHEVAFAYSDYRDVGDLKLPFVIAEIRPDIPLEIEIESYQLNQPIADELFRNPLTDQMQRQPYDVSLQTIPRRVYKEFDGLYRDRWYRGWGIPFPPTESWLFNVVVSEKYGRYVEPRSITMVGFAGAARLKTVSLSGAALAALKQYPVSRFAPQEEIYDFRHYFSEPATLAIDRILYQLSVALPDGKTITRSLEIPLSRYRQRTKLIFPIQGNFAILDGHEFHMLGHKYEWSQHYAYDIVALGPEFDFVRNNGARREDFSGWHREVVATAAGTVVFARNDVTDEMGKDEYLALENGLFAIGGNLVIIDHGNNESSVYAHMSEGTVRVKAGDRVRQGEVIGLLGSSAGGIPHLHYQLQDNNRWMAGDGLPSVFENVEFAVFGVSVPSPVTGPPYTARPSAPVPRN